MNTGVYVEDLVVTISKATVTAGAWAASGNAVSICGVSNIDATEGARAQKVTKAYNCGTQVFHAKEPDMGTATLTIAVYDTTDLGQKMLYDAAIDDKFLLKVEYSPTKTEQLRLQKTQSEKRNMGTDEVIIGATMELGLHGGWELVTP